MQGIMLEGKAHGNQACQAWLTTR